MPPRIITIVDPGSGATARVLPELGFNCFSFQPVVEGQPIEVLWSAAGFESGTLRSTASGIPILFPFAGRLRGGSLRYGNRQVPLVIDTRLGFAIHGFVHNRPWRVLAEKPNSVTGEFHALRDDPVLADLWPADFRIRVCYEVGNNTLSCQITVENPGDAPLPCGLGTHGYFRLPLGSDGDRDTCRLYVPAHRYWELSGMLPTGQIPPVDAARDLSSGMRFGKAKLDDVLTDLETQSGKVLCRIDDIAAGRRLLLEFDELFRHCVVFTPPHREAICFEPYTTVPDAFSLAERGIETGLRVLKPGESLQANIDLKLDG